MSVYSVNAQPLKDLREKFLKATNTEGLTLMEEAYEAGATFTEIARATGFTVRSVEVRLEN